MKPVTTFVAGALALAAVPALAQDRVLTEHEQRVHDIYRDIIAFRTAEGYGQVDDMVAYLTGRLSEAGFANDDIMVSDYVNDGDPTQGLIVRYRGDGSSGEKPIVLLAHMDVVDALPEDWVRNPFELIEEDGYFYGRGTMDNKYGVANLTGTFIRLKEEGWTPNRDLYLVFSGDEETGMTSTKAQAKWVAENVDPAFVLNSDAGGVGLTEDYRPMAQRVQAAEKTFVTYELTITNQGGHSSRPRKDNAIYELADALQKVRDYQFPVRATPLTRSYLGALGQAIPGPMGDALKAFAADPDDAEALAMLRTHPEFLGTTGTTCVATMLKAGHAENALPQTATATVNCRVFPGEGVEATKQRLAEAVGNPGVTITTLGDPTESEGSDFREDVRAALTKSLEARYGAAIPIIPYMESGGTDGMHYRALGYNTVGISGGASRPQDVYAHGLDERVRVDAFYAGLDHWTIILKELAGS
ncbi:M20/M25/M40 family metallo-hydrolase [Qipengyuania sphaerica]|uniref:M20/M25/M40 family metallo-hydrolase n=1 Tax=Qipengyuania sphaerica TaxID=2867243 RepID=UPI001C879920|nr:M20/M25/M40 family metallo-hydrolase [Qipengyuania sphaerica]MBX7539566.1 M20/M25/M40 family metallo-hydrolase [Qipengyuania sphaerica]